VDLDGVVDALDAELLHAVTETIVPPMFVRTVGLTGSGDLRDAIEAAGLTAETGDLGDADLVLVEDPSLDTLTDLDARTPGHAIFALLGDAPDVTELADATSRAERVVGFRVVGKRLVEIVEGDATSDATAQAAANVAQAMRRQAVRCACPLAGRIDSLEAACAVVDAGLAEVRGVDVALSAGGGPRLFAEADQQGLDTLADPPPLVRRLVAQGRLGASAGQGFYAYPPAGDGPVIVDRRDDVAVLWLANPPANSLSPEVVAAVRAAWAEIAGDVHAMVLASANPLLFCAGADIKAFTQMDEAAGRQLLDDVHGAVAEWEASRVVTVAAVNGLAFGGGCELAMACDVRVAAFSATFGQPEINLGIIPGFGGTQRLPRLVGHAKALEMNLGGEAISAEDAYAHGLVNRVVADHELFDTALNAACALAAKAPVAVEQIKRVSGRGMDAEKEGFIAAFGSADAREGIGAFVEKRRPRWSGE
jgi:enoyl-CoA hydratase/3-hydroxyacyl-CoA dehydrogenase